MMVLSRGFALWILSSQLFLIIVEIIKSLDKQTIEYFWYFSEVKLFFTTVIFTRIVFLAFLGALCLFFAVISY